MNSVNHRRMGDGRRLAAILAAIFLAMLPIRLPAVAGTFQVDPVSIELLPGRRTTALSVRNRGGEPVSIRVHLYRWTQENGEDVHSETNELIASPPIFTVAPGGTQLVRIGPRGQDLQGAYRVILEEIPPAAGEGSGIRVALRMNLPLYVLPHGGGRPNLSWSAWRTSGGDVVIEARNQGSRHSQILGIGSIDPAGGEIALSSEMGVVLPGSARRWNVGRRPDLGPGANLQLRIRNGSGEISDSRIAVERR